MSHADFRTLVAGFPRSEGHVRCETTLEGVLEITIANPRKKNALTPHMMVELGHAVQSPAAQHAAAVILRGEGGPFCSGGDLDAVRDHLGQAGTGGLLAAFMAEAIDQLVSQAAVVIGVLDGPALGGGAELLMGCDEIFASPRAAVGFVQVRLGVSPGFGGAGRAVAKLGSRRAMLLYTHPKLCSGSELEQFELVDHWSEEPLAAARSRAADLASLPRAALRETVATLRAHAGPPSPAGRSRELAAFNLLWGGAEHREALSRR